MKRIFGKHLVSWGITLLTVLSGIIAIMLAGPDTAVPIHWDINGNADQTTSALKAYSLMPAFQVFTILLLSNLHYLEPRQENLKKSQNVIKIVTQATTCLFAASQGAIIVESFGLFDGQYIIIYSLAILFMVIGNFLGKLHSTFTVGIRTPWTLASDKVWRKTHRLGGKLMMTAGGVVLIGSLVVSPEHHFQILLGSLLAATIIPVVYSWVLWRREQA